MYTHISKKGINIFLYINLNVLMILCWATLIAVLGRMRPAGHALDSPDLDILQNLSLATRLTSIYRLYGIGIYFQNILAY